MNNRQKRMLGLSSVIMGLIVPLIIILSIITVPYIISFKANKIVIAKRAFLDKKLPFVIDNKLVEFDQIGCGDSQVPENLKRFFIEDLSLKTQAGKLLDLVNPQTNNACQFSSIPSYYIIDFNAKTSTLVPLNNKISIDISGIDSIRSKFSFLQPQYIIKNSKVNLTITSDKLTANYASLFNYSLKREVIFTQELTQDLNQDQYQDINNPTNIEVLGFVN
jgi:hypothetical protein